MCVCVCVCVYMSAPVYWSPLIASSTLCAIYFVFPLTLYLTYKFTHISQLHGPGADHFFHVVSPFV